MKSLHKEGDLDKLGILSRRQEHFRPDLPSLEISKAMIRKVPTPRKIDVEDERVPFIIGHLKENY